MKIFRTHFMILTLLGSCLFLSGCASKGVIVYGESFNGTAGAVQEAQAAIANAEGFGCRVKSIGDGVGGPSLEGGLLISVPVLLRCPVGTPELIPTTGKAVTP